MQNKLFSATLLILLCVLHSKAFFGQDLDYTSQRTVHLRDGTAVTLFAQVIGTGADARAGKSYYYLPPEIMLAKNPLTQVPQFLFLKYLTEEREDQGGVSGALLHFLVKWGVQPSQLAELKSKLNAEVPGSVIKGPVKLFPPDGDSYAITSATLNDKSTMTRSLVASGTAPLLEGELLAVAANLNKTGAQLLASTFEKTKSVTDVSVTFRYKYFTRINGLRAKITIDYQKVAELKKFDKKQNAKDWKEIHTLLDKLQETQAIKVWIDQGISNSVSDKMTEIIFQILLAKLTTPVEDTSTIKGPTQDGSVGEQKATKYGFSSYFIQHLARKKVDVINVEYNYQLPLQAQITGNLASWYNSVKDNRNCISAVNLNDPFYTHKDVHFMLEMESDELFNQAINYVTVKVRKKRNSGNFFNGSVTFNKKSVADSGVIATLTYAGGEDKNPDMYEYMVQWSIRGGEMYPAAPSWEKGQLETVTLKPPVAARNIEFEGDIEKLKASDITRVTLQVRYKKFNEECEENINISTVKNEPIVSKTIFMDREATAYVYRLIFNHATSGKLALPWTAKVNDNYVYALIPDELTNASSALFTNAAEAGKSISPTEPGGKVTTDKVLESFKDVLGTNKNAQH